MRQSSKNSRPATKLFDHVRELRMRLLVSAIALVIAGVAVYFFYEPILALLRSPLNAPLYYSTPAGSFAFIMKICFMGALAVTIPVIIYNLIMFVRPVFAEKLSLARVYGTTALSAVLAAAGAAFAFIFIIPGSLQFFEGFQVDGLSALISADSYLGFVTNVIITFIIVFQLPLLIAFIDSIHPLPPIKLLKMEKWAVLGSLVVSLLVPFAFDLTTSLMIAAPIIVLYNLSIIIVLLQHAYLKHSNHTTRATNNTSRADAKTSPLPTSSLSLSELAFEGLPNDSLDDYIHREFETTTPVAQPTTRRVTMDILSPSLARPLTITPRIRVLTDSQQAALSSRVPLISDMRRRQKPSRALTSQ